MPSHLFNRILSCLIFLGFLLPSSICPGAEKQESGLIPLKALLTPFISFAPFFIAEEEGYFKEQGLVVHSINLDDASKAIPSLLKGDLDIVGGSISVAMLNAMARGGRMRIVADKAYISPAECDHFALLARREVFKDGKIADPTRLKGKRIAVKPARSTEYFLERVLESAGLTMRDIAVVNIPDEIMVEAMKNGSIDGAVTAEPWITRAADAGQGRVFSSAGQFIPGFQVAMVLYGPNLLDRNPVAGRKFMAAYLKAVGQYGRGKTKRNLDILNKYTGLNHDFLNRACWAPIRGDGRIDLQSILDFQSWALMKGYLDKAVKKEDLWNSSFVEHGSKILTSLPDRSN